LEISEKSEATKDMLSSFSLHLFLSPRRQCV